eukprot:8375669-Pyramimonas_sp.AAC.1
MNSTSVAEPSAGSARSDSQSTCCMSESVRARRIDGPLPLPSPWGHPRRKCCALWHMSHFVVLPLASFGFPFKSCKSCCARDAPTPRALNILPVRIWKLGILKPAASAS